MKNYFTDIDDFSISNWKKCQEGKFEYTRKNIEKGDAKQDIEAWELIYSSYIDFFGFSKKFENYLMLQKQYIEKLKEYAIDGDRFIWNEINSLKSEMDAIVSEIGGKPDTLDSAIIHVSKWMGGGFINEKKTTVKQFYSAYDKMIEDGKKN
jgi:hypothetical protein